MIYFKNFVKYSIYLILGILVTYLFCIPLRSYYLQFGDYPFSYEHESWGHFGDFVGGIYNPIIGVLTLGFTVYIAYIANKITKQQSLPYCNIIFNDYEKLVGVDIENAGNGPLIINSICIYELSDNGKNNIKIMDLLDSVSTKDVWANYVEEVENRAISAGNRLNLFKWIPQGTSHVSDNSLKKKLREKLSTKVIEVRFTDIYNHEFSNTFRTMEFFGRHTDEKRKYGKKDKINTTI